MSNHFKEFGSNAIGKDEGDAINYAKELNKQGKRNIKIEHHINWWEPENMGMGEHLCFTVYWD